MTSRVEEAMFPVRTEQPRSKALAAPRVRLTASQRILFVFALLTFGLASAYSSGARLRAIVDAWRGSYGPPPRTGRR